MNKFVFLLIPIIFLSGCATHVIFTDKAHKQETLDCDTVSLFLDKNGDFYPIDSTVDENRKISKQELIRSRANHLYQPLNRGSKELVVFIHGYNNDFYEAKTNFDLLRDEVLNSTQGQGRQFVFLNIYWDGFKGNPISGAWRKAQYSGPLVGFRLREFFNALIDAYSGVDSPSATFITHSSGAFVLGALFGNPTEALPLLKNPDGLENYKVFRTNRKGNAELAYAIPEFSSLRLGMIAAATSTLTFNSIDTTDADNSQGGILAKNVTMLFSMNKYDFALSKVFQLQNFNIFGATGAGTDKKLYCDELAVLKDRKNVESVAAIHFEKPDTPWYWPINNHSLFNDGYLHREDAKNLFFNAIMNKDYSDPNGLLVDCPIKEDAS